MDIKIISKYIYILNLELLKNICDKLKINYYINIELENGKIKQTNEILHKEIIIKLIIKKLKTNQSKK
jgi:hypothetical protein